MSINIDPLASRINEKLAALEKGQETLIPLLMDVAVDCHIVNVQNKDRKNALMAQLNCDKSEFSKYAAIGKNEYIRYPNVIGCLTGRLSVDYEIARCKNLTIDAAIEKGLLSKDSKPKRADIVAFRNRVEGKLKDAESARVVFATIEIPADTSVEDRTALDEWLNSLVKRMKQAKIVRAKDRITALEKAKEKIAPMVDASVRSAARHCIGWRKKEQLPENWSEVCRTGTYTEIRDLLAPFSVNFDELKVTALEDVLVPIPGVHKSDSWKAMTLIREKDPRFPFDLVEKLSAGATLDEFIKQNDDQPASLNEEEAKQEEQAKRTKGQAVKPSAVRPSSPVRSSPVKPSPVKWAAKLSGKPKRKGSRSGRRNG